MTIFAADTSGKTCSAAVMKDGRVVFEGLINRGLTHSETFLSLCDEVFCGAGCAPSDVDYFAVTRGPGSFTGLRIGMGVIKGFAFPMNKPCAAVPTLEAMARGVLFSDAVIAPVIDARRERVYCAAYLMRLDGKLVKIMEECVLSLEELRDSLLKFMLPVLFVGDAKDICSSFCEEELTVVGAPKHFEPLRASAVAAVALEHIEEGKTVFAEQLAPFYMQKSQAQRELEKRVKDAESKS